MVEKVWTDKQLIKLRELFVYKNITDEDKLAKLLGRSRLSIIYILTKLGIRKQKTLKQIEFEKRTTRKDLLEKICKLLKVDKLNLNKKEDLELLYKEIGRS